MDNVGIIRRIDELGRIVIPKEIRTNFRIKNGECFEIFSREKEIIMRRYSLIENYPEMLEKLFNIIHSLTGLDFILTDNSKITYIYNDEYNKYLDTYLENTYLKKLNYRKNIISEKESINITDSFLLNVNYIMQPLIVNGDIIGSIFAFKEEKIVDYDKVSMDIIYKLLIKYLEE